MPTQPQHPSSDFTFVRACVTHLIPLFSHFIYFCVFTFTLWSRFSHLGPNAAHPSAFQPHVGTPPSLHLARKYTDAPLGRLPPVRAYPECHAGSGWSQSREQAGQEGVRQANPRIFRGAVKRRGAAKECAVHKGQTCVTSSLKHVLCLTNPTQKLEASMYYP